MGHTYICIYNYPDLLELHGKMMIHIWIWGDHTFFLDSSIYVGSNSFNGTGKQVDHFGLKAKLIPFTSQSRRFADATIGAVNYVRENRKNKHRA